uniref:Cap-specific mRNA (nucleoside-2'-O-)-methyltransferase 1 n=1 Tax=Cyprinus carpio TaxID=7962 RepID=A0A8C2HB36_CYPCA
MKRGAQQALGEPLKKRKVLREDSSDEDEESSQRTTSQDSSQSESLSDVEDHKPSFSRASNSQNAEGNDASHDASSKFPMYNRVSQKLMAKMGFREGEGLGKDGQGRKEIVEASTQRGRRGLGLTLKGFQGDLNVDWQDEPEPSAIESVTWFPESSPEIPDADELKDWMAVGQKKLKIDDETEFCSENLLHLLLRCKTVFDDLEGEEMRRARTRSNPYETIRGAFFLNRAAMKMANMDHVFDYMFTNPKDSQGRPQTRDKDGELLYFGDVCAGPGGFSEYVLWRRRWHAKGFGMTLKGSNDFKLEDFYAAPSELFEAYYGEGGIDGDGDITRPENITAFRNFVLDSTEGRGLHFLMADGGFSVEGQENIQEILSKQLLLCQFLTAMSVVRPGGHFVCKTFDLFTPFSVGLIYLLYLCFERVSLFKPVTSRPANSERYVVCKSLKPGTDAVREYMFTINLKLNQFRHSERDVTEVVPLDIIKGDTDFFQFMINSNESHCAVQIKALAKIHAYVRDTTLFEAKQADIRKECLKLWGGPDMDSFNSRPTALNSGNLEKLQHVLDYRCIVGGGEQLFLLGLGRSQIYTWDGKAPLRWKKLENFKLELPRDTLLSAEIVQELKGEGKAQRRINAVHILDALVLNGTDVRDQHFNQRIQMAEKFVKAVSKPSAFNHCNHIHVTKSSGGMPRLSYTGRDDRHFLPSGLYIIKTVNDPWTMAFSKSSKRKFFYNKQTKESTYELPPGSVAPFHACHQDRLFWAWEEGVRVHDSQTRVNPDKLSKDEVLSFIHQHCQQ